MPHINSSKYIPTHPQHTLKKMVIFNLMTYNQTIKKKKKLKHLIKFNNSWQHLWGISNIYTTCNQSVFNCFCYNTRKMFNLSTSSCNLDLFHPFCRNLKSFHDFLSSVGSAAARNLPVVAVIHSEPLMQHKIKHQTYFCLRGKRKKSDSSEREIRRAVCQTGFFFYYFFC